MKYSPLIRCGFLIGLVAVLNQSAHAQSDNELPQEVYLYQGDAPGSEGLSQETKKVRPGKDRVVSNVHRPLLYPYLPREGTETGMAVIIAPGGGHNSLWSTHEGHTPAKYFAEHGIAAFVLEYRLAEERGSKYTVDEHALGDLHRAIRLVRSRAESWKIDPNRVGVMGFSAGGELTALSGMRFDAGDDSSDDAVEQQSSRPDYIALIYPGRSHRYEPQPETPPTFIAAGFGDRPDISQGMAEVYLKNKRAGIPTELHIYSNAGHGFGLRDGRPGSVMKWVDRFIDWAGDRQLLGTPEKNVGYTATPGKAVSASESTPEDAQDGITIRRDIAYRKGDSKAWRLDLAMPNEPAKGLRAALVIVHGGGWRGGSKDTDVYQKMMIDYAKKGYVTINVEYRLTGEAPFPACIEDVKCAVRWLRAHAKEYHVDPDRIGAYGHSAGAHLAMMLAMVPKSAGLEGDGGWDEYSSVVNVAAAGSPPTELGRDVPMAKTEWWPIGYISADSAPLFLIQGSNDRIVRAELTDDFVEKMKAKKANIEYLKVDGARHGVAYNEYLDVTDPAIEAFFAKHLKPEMDVTAAATSSGAEEAAAMDALLQSLVDQKKVSSVVGFVAKGGQVKYQKAFGWKDVESQVPATVDDYYVLFSQTKAVVSVAFMTLVEQGLVDVDDPVSKYFPEIPNQVVTEVNEDGTYETRPVASPMTFAHLLSHSSGLNAGLVRQFRRAERQQSDRPPGFGGRTPRKVPAGQHSGGGNSDAKYLKDEMHALVKYPLGFDPGTEWSYHVSTNMLGYMIERISGKPLREYVKETVLEPLGMDDTDWYYEPEAVNRFVKPYRVVDGRLEPASTMYSEGTISKEQTYCEGALGLNGPIGDYAKFCQMMLNQGELNGRRVLKPETVKLMTTVNQLPEKNAGGKGFQFGLGFELYNEHKKPVPEVSNSAYAWGGMMGTQYIIDPEHDMIALFYINMYGAGSLYPSFLGNAYQLITE